MRVAVLRLLLLPLIISGSAVGFAAPGGDDEDAPLPAGLVARLRSGDGAEVTRIEPIPRLVGDAVHPSLSGRLEASWAGKVLAAHDTYIFHLEPSSLSDATLTIGGHPIRRGEPVELSAGLHSFVLRGIHRKGMPTLLLSWQGKKFAREAVPPRVLFHEPADETPALRRQQQRDRGAVLAATLGCQRCHEAPGPTAFDHLLQPVQDLPGPRLDAVRERLQAGSVAAFLADPQAVRPGARMPALFGASAAEREACEIVAAHLVAGQDSKRSRTPSPGAASAGRKVFDACGCAACHPSTPRPPDLTAPPPLAGLATRWTAAGLADFLHRPLLTRPHGRMPDFGLSTQQSADVAAHLLSRNDAGRPSEAEAPAEPRNEHLRRQWQALGLDAARFDSLPAGERLSAVAVRIMAARGCLQCHAANTHGFRPLPREPLPLRSGERGCLAERQAGRGNAPRWTFPGADRAALAAWVAVLRPTDVSSAAETIRIDVQRLHCNACHSNEGAGGEGLIASLGGSAAAKFRTPPDLTSVAGRLRPERLFAYLRHGAGQPLRPWLGARMPGFGDRGGRLALGLVMRDLAATPDPAAWWTEIQKPPPPAPTPPPNHIELARYLVSPRALACVNCHSLNGSQSSAVPDPTTRGPDLGVIAAHLRPEYFRRLLRDPARVFHGTTMPQAFPGDSPLPLPGLEKIGPALPMEALWQYLSLGKDAPPPQAPDAATLPISPDAPPVVQRGAVRVEDRVFGRGIALGFPDGCLLFDADTFRPAAIWKGEFLSGSLDKYFGTTWRPGTAAERLDSTLPSLVYRPAGGEWQFPPLPADTDYNHGSRFEGYTIAPTAVTFRARVLLEGHPVVVRHTLRVDHREGWHGYVAEFDADGVPTGGRLGFLLPGGKRDSFDVDGKPAADSRKVSLVVYTATSRTHALRFDLGHKRTWESWKKDESIIASASAEVDRKLHLRYDWWVSTGNTAPRSAEIEALCDPARLAPEHRVMKKPTPLPPPRETPPLPRETPFTYKIEPIAGPKGGWRTSGITVAPDGTAYALDMPAGRLYRSRYADFPTPDWRLYAAGLNQPLGLATIGNRVFVTQRPELTEILAHDPDRMADEYRSVTGGPWPQGDGYHEYLFGPTLSTDGGLYLGVNCGHFWPHGGATRLGRLKGSLLRVDPSGHIDEIARGARVPNGISRGPDGTMVFLDNQGDWIPVCKVAVLHKGRFYGHPETDHDALPPGRQPDGVAACWLPYEDIRSASAPVLDETAGRFGPFAGQLFLGDVGYGGNRGLWRVALEKVGDDYQGACFRFLEDQPLGVQQMTFAPDGHLLAACLTGGIYRIRHGGKTPFEMHHVSLQPGGKGFVIHLTKPLAADVTLTAADVVVRHWHYRYGPAYGSPRVDERQAAVEGVVISANRRQVEVKVAVTAAPGGAMYHLTLPRLRDGDGAELVHREAWYTVQQLGR
jgi:mono/diheme cytochrome c family protein